MPNISVLYGALRAMPHDVAEANLKFFPAKFTKIELGTLTWALVPVLLEVGPKELCVFVALDPREKFGICELTSNHILFW